MRHPSPPIKGQKEGPCTEGGEAGEGMGGDTWDGIFKKGDRQGRLGGLVGEKLRSLGRGIGGQVDLYRTPHHHLYVVKTFHPKEKHESRKEYRVRVLHEYRVLQSLQPHPHVVAALGYTCSLPLRRPYQVRLVLEYSRYPLSKVARAGLSKAEIQCYWKQMVRAVGYLHAHGVCHRDLKLDNVMVSEGGTVQLIDFGVASVGDPASLVVGIVGTTQCMAPEMLRQIRYQGPPVDMWLLGVLYVYLTNKGFPWQCAKPSDKNYHQFAVEADWLVVMPSPHYDGTEGFGGLLMVDPGERLTCAEMERNPWFEGLNLCEENYLCSIDHPAALKRLA